MAPPELEDLMAEPGSAGLMLDFDGTLSEIASSPEAARAVEGLAPVLDRLATRYRVVAVISGRPVAEVAGLVGASIRYFGLYGLEGDGGPTPEAARLAGEVARALPDVERAAAYVPGARVERKGLSVAVHYRAAADPEAARRSLLERLAAVAEANRLEVMEGKRVIELAAGRPNKGAVVERLVREESLRHALYAGDDLADLDAFDSLDRLSADGVRGHKVAVRSAETPDRLVEAADLVVEGPSDLLALLEVLAA